MYRSRCKHRFLSGERCTKKRFHPGNCKGSTVKAYDRYRAAGLCGHCGKTPSLTYTCQTCLTARRLNVARNKALAERRDAARLNRLEDK